MPPRVRLYYALRRLGARHPSLMPVSYFVDCSSHLRQQDQTGGRPLWSSPCAQDCKFQSQSRYSNALEIPNHVATLQLAACALAASQFVLLGLEIHTRNKTPASVPSAVLSTIAAILVLPLSHYEHLRTYRPSSLLVAFLAATALLEAVRTRTQWLLGDVALASAFSASVAMRLTGVYLEARNKRGVLLIQGKVASETLAGPISRTVFHWLNGLMRRGYSRILGPSDLVPIDGRLLSGHLRQRFHSVVDGLHGTEDNPKLV